jgi:hypothetical protein
LRENGTPAQIRTLPKPTASREISAFMSFVGSLVLKVFAALIH